jgi:hypothetical protein
MPGEACFAGELFFAKPSPTGVMLGFVPTADKVRHVVDVPVLMLKAKR